MKQLKDIIQEKLTIGSKTKVNVRNRDTWTIDDAVNGDIVEDVGVGDLLFIYKGLNKDLHINNTSGNTIVYHAYYINDDRKKLGVGVDTGVGVTYNIESYKLATDEQCEEFYQALKDNGYKWDNNKKEIVKI